MNTISKLAVALLLGVSVLPAIAQAQGSPMKHYRKPGVNHRVNSELYRINKGVQGGKLTAGQASRFDAREARIEAKAAHDRARHGGRLTIAEKRNLEHNLSVTSRKIARAKHM